MPLNLGNYANQLTPPVSPADMPTVATPAATSSGFGGAGSASVGLSAGMAVGQMVGSVFGYLTQKAMLDGQLTQAQLAADHQDAMGQIGMKAQLKQLEIAEKKQAYMVKAQDALNKATEKRKAAEDQGRIVTAEKKEYETTKKMGDLNPAAVKQFDKLARNNYSYGTPH
jgi:hypothetical protein